LLKFVLFFKTLTTKRTKMKKNSPSTNSNYEAAISELEAIVNQMESGSLPLEQSLSAYKRGAELIKLCQKALIEAEQQVRILSEDNQLSPFTQEENN
jgi:exodeoxyribonuclease VII small subunit